MQGVRLRSNPSKNTNNRRMGKELVWCKSELIFSAQLARGVALALYFPLFADVSWACAARGASGLIAMM